jgi:hypothetical protein
MSTVVVYIKKTACEQDQRTSGRYGGSDEQKTVFKVNVIDGHEIDVPTKIRSWRRNDNESFVKRLH